LITVSETKELEKAHQELEKLKKEASDLKKNEARLQARAETAKSYTINSELN